VKGVFEWDTRIRLRRGEETPSLCVLNGVAAASSPPASHHSDERPKE
jgi:hypothetical protein